MEIIEKFLCFYFTIFTCICLVNCDILVVKADKVKNEPGELIEESGEATEIQPRFLPPFSASFSLGVGGNAAQSFSVAGGPDGIGLSQSSSLTDGTSANGKPGFSSSQSSSLTAGLNGISVADSNAFSSNHPLYGQNSQANGNAFALGQSSASAHGDVVDGLAVSGAQSAVGSTHTQASSGLQNLGPVHQYRPNAGLTSSYVQPGYGNGYGDNYNNYSQDRQPKLSITVSDNNKNNGRQHPTGGWYEVPDDSSWRQPDWCRNYQGWYRDPRCRGPRVSISKPNYRPPGNSRPYYQSVRDPRENSPSLQVSGVTASTNAQVRPGGLSIVPSMSLSQGGFRPSGLTINQAQSSGNAQTHTHGGSGSNNMRTDGLQVSLGSSRPSGSSQGISISTAPKGHSSSQTSGLSVGSGSAHGTANSGLGITFPGQTSRPSQHQIIPQEFVRSAKTGKKKKETDPLDELITDLTDTVYDLLDY